MRSALHLALFSVVLAGFAVSTAARAQQNFYNEIQLAVDATRIDVDKVHREDEGRIESALKRRLKMFTKTGDGTVKMEGFSAIRMRVPVERITPTQLNTLVRTGQVEIRILDDLRTATNPDGRYEISNINITGGGKEQQSQMRFFDTRAGKNVPVKDFLARSPLVVDSGDIAPNGAGVTSGDGYNAIRVQFTTAGTRKLEGAIKKAGRILAVTLDGEIISLTVTSGEQKAPKKKKQPGDSSASDVPQLDIFGGFNTLDEANDLAAILNAGPLPVPLKVVNTRVITE